MKLLDCPYEELIVLRNDIYIALGLDLDEKDRSTILRAINVNINSMKFVAFPIHKWFTLYLIKNSPAIIGEGVIKYYKWNANRILSDEESLYVVYEETKNDIRILGTLTYKEISNLFIYFVCEAGVDGHRCRVLDTYSDDDSHLYDILFLNDTFPMSNIDNYENCDIIETKTEMTLSNFIQEFSHRITRSMCIKCETFEEFDRVSDYIHEQLKGSDDYINNRILLHRENETLTIEIYIFDDVIDKSVVLKIPIA